MWRRRARLQPRFGAETLAVTRRVSVSCTPRKAAPMRTWKPLVQSLPSFDGLKGLVQLATLVTGGLYGSVWTRNSLCPLPGASTDCARGGSPGHAITSGLRRLNWGGPLYQRRGTVSACNFFSNWRVRVAMVRRPMQFGAAIPNPSRFWRSPGITRAIMHMQL